MGGPLCLGSLRLRVCFGESKFQLDDFAMRAKIQRLEKTNQRERALARFQAASLISAHTMAVSPAVANFYVKVLLAGFDVPEGTSFTLLVNPSWAPRGASRFRELVEANFYDDSRFFRVLDGDYDIWIAQFGIAGDPATNRKWVRGATSPTSKPAELPK